MACQVYRYNIVMDIRTEYIVAVYNTHTLIYTYIYILSAF